MAGLYFSGISGFTLITDFGFLLLRLITIMHQEPTYLKDDTQRTERGVPSLDQACLPMGDRDTLRASLYLSLRKY